MTPVVDFSGSTPTYSTTMEVGNYCLEADAVTSDTIKDHDSDGSSETEYMDGPDDSSDDHDSEPETDDFLTSQASVVEFSNDASDEAVADTVDEFSSDCYPADASDVPHEGVFEISSNFESSLAGLVSADQMSPDRFHTLSDEECQAYINEQYELLLKNLRDAYSHLSNEEKNEPMTPVLAFNISVRLLQEYGVGADSFDSVLELCNIFGAQKQQAFLKIMKQAVKEVTNELKKKNKELQSRLTDATNPFLHKPFQISYYTAELRANQPDNPDYQGMFRLLDEMVNVEEAMKAKKAEYDLLQAELSSRRQEYRCLENMLRPGQRRPLFRFREGSRRSRRALFHTQIPGFTQDSSSQVPTSSNTESSITDALVSYKRYTREDDEDDQEARPVKRKATVASKKV